MAAMLAIYTERVNTARYIYIIYIASKEVSICLTGFNHLLLGSALLYLLTIFFF
jgi:hypothetical protein